MKKIKFFKRIDKDSPFNDPSFCAEMDRRRSDMESGKDKGVSWEEVKANTEKLLKEARVKRSNSSTL